MYSGRAWFGVPSRQKGQDVVDPVHDDEAHRLANELGFTRREKKATGTSILIVDSGVDCEELRSSIEEWWWPRLLDESLGLDILLYEETKLLQPPRPRSRTELKPFIHCFEMAINRSAPTGKHEKAQPMNKWNGEVSLGTFGFCLLDEKDLAEEPLQQKVGKVALIRGSRMVVSYLEVGGSMPLPCVGSFVASSEIDNALRLSEPPSHDKWDPYSARLQDLEEEERPVVKAVIDRLKQGLRKFANDAAPAIPQQDLHLRSLEKLLGNIFKPPTTNTGGNGGHTADPIQIKFVEQPHVLVDGDGVCTAGSFRVMLTDEADKKYAHVALEVECLVVEDEGVSKEDPISVSVKTADVAHKVDQKNPARLLFKLDRETKPKFAFKSAAYQADWTTRISVRVTETT